MLWRHLRCSCRRPSAPMGALQAGLAPSTPVENGSVALALADRRSRGSKPMRLIPTRVHGVVGYLWATALLLAPRLLPFPAGSPEAITVRATGAGAIAYAALTHGLRAWARAGLDHAPAPRPGPRGRRGARCVSVAAGILGPDTVPATVLRPLRRSGGPLDSHAAGTRGGAAPGGSTARVSAAASCSRSRERIFQSSRCVPGFRSTLTIGVGECTAHPREVVEAALAHTEVRSGEADTNPHNV